MASGDRNLKSKNLLNLNQSPNDENNIDLISGSLKPEHKNNLEENDNVSDSSIEVNVTTYSLKLTVIGDTNVGKTSIIYRYDENKFEQDKILSTISCTYRKKKMKIDPYTELDMQIWDTAGQERFRSMTRSYLRNSQGIFIVFDLTNKKSYENLESWFEEIKNGDVDDKNCVKMLIGNKLDAEENKEVNDDDVKKLCEEKNIKYLKVSAKNGINIDTMFEMMGHACVKILQENEDNINNNRKKSEHNILLQKSIDEEIIADREIISINSKDKKCC